MNFYHSPLRLPLPEERAVVRCCKPVSRILCLLCQLPFVCHCIINRHHLSGISIAAYLYLPTHPARASRPQALVYLAFQHARFTRIQPSGRKPWALTPRFHPHLCCCQQVGGHFLWHCLVRLRRSPAVSGMHCPVLSGLSLWCFRITRWRSLQRGKDRGNKNSGGEGIGSKVFKKFVLVT